VGSQADDYALDVFDGGQDAADAQGVRRRALWLGPDGGGCVELHRPEPAVSVGVRTTATSILTSSRPATRAAQLPSTTVLPSSSRPISTKNAVTASRSSTAMLPSPSAGSSWCFSFDRAASHGRVQPSNEQAHDVSDSGTGLRGPPDTKVLMGRESQFEIGFGVPDPKDVVLEIALHAAPFRPSLLHSTYADDSSRCRNRPTGACRRVNFEWCLAWL
jgi:hypothetical protein